MQGEAGAGVKSAVLHEVVKEGHATEVTPCRNPQEGDDGMEALCKDPEARLGARFTGLQKGPGLGPEGPAWQTEGQQMEGRPTQPTCACYCSSPQGWSSGSPETERSS